MGLGHNLTHGTPVRRLIEQGYVNGNNFIQVGLRGYAPGTGTSEPNGLTPRELFPLPRRLGAETNLIGVELVEANPLVDPTYVTPLVANRCLRELFTGIAVRKKGITEKHYLSPETLDHGQG